jgi:hypothetical protein
VVFSRLDLVGAVVMVETCLDFGRGVGTSPAQRALRSGVRNDRLHADVGPR